MAVVRFHKPGYLPKCVALWPRFVNLIIEIYSSAGRYLVLNLQSVYSCWFMNNLVRYVCMHVITISNQDIKTTEL